jgi:hypothetical protein
MALTKVIGDGLGGTNDLTVDTTTLTVDATNNRVGIGSATPTKVLDITESASADTGQLKLTYDGGDGNRAGFILKNTHTGGREYGIYAGNNSTGGGLGNSLGIADNTASTAYRLLIDSAGAVTMPSQPAFSAHKNGTDQSNVATTESTVTWTHERFDNNADFDLDNNRFVAPVTGKYFLQIQVRLENLDTAAGYYIINITTSNEVYNFILDPDYFDSDAVYYSIASSVLADMDANDTASIVVIQSGGTAQTDIDGNQEYTWFSGHLVC